MESTISELDTHYGYLQEANYALSLLATNDVENHIIAREIADRLATNLNMRDSINKVSIESFRTHNSISVNLSTEDVESMLTKIISFIGSTMESLSYNLNKAWARVKKMSSVHSKAYNLFLTQLKSAKVDKFEIKDISDLPEGIGNLYLLTDKNFSKALDALKQLSDPAHLQETIDRLIKFVKEINQDLKGDELTSLDRTKKIEALIKDLDKINPSFSNGGFPAGYGPLTPIISGNKIRTPCLRADGNTIKVEVVTNSADGNLKGSTTVPVRHIIDEVEFGKNSLDGLGVLIEKMNHLRNSVKDSVKTLDKKHVSSVNNGSILQDVIKLNRTIISAITKVATLNIQSIMTAHSLRISLGYYVTKQISEKAADAYDNEKGK